MRVLPVDNSRSLPPLEETRSAARARLGRVLTEVALVILVPCACLVACGMWDADLASGLLSMPPKGSKQHSIPVTDAVRLNHDTALTLQLHGRLRLWSFSSSASVGEIQSHIPETCCAAYSPTQNLLAVGSFGGQIEIWDLNHSGRPVSMHAPKLCMICDCQFTPDGKKLFTSSSSGHINAWDPQTLARLETWRPPGPVQTVRTLAISADGHRLLAGMFSGRVQVWDLQTSRPLHTHQIAVPSADVPHGALSIEYVSFGPRDHEFIAASRAHGAGVWDIHTGASLRQFKGIASPLRTGATSPDGQRFAAGLTDGSVVTWDTTTGQQIGAVLRHPSSVKTLLFQGDGKALLAGDWDGQVYFHRD